MDRRIGTLEQAQAEVHVWQEERNQAHVTNAHALVVLADPGIEVLDIEGDELAQARNLGREVTHAARQQGLQQGGSKGAQFVREPLTAGKGAFNVKAIERVI